MEEPERRSYEPLKGFDGWRDVNPSSDRWNAVVSLVGEIRGENVDFKWLDGPLRASAYQSGAVEGLHAGDRGLTITLMNAVSNWQAQVREAEEGDEVDTVAFIEAGYGALEMALDVATNDRPVTEAWLRQLHEVVCRPQQTYLVTTPTGQSQRQLLPKGEYKRDDNHVLLPGGEMLMFAPAQEVRPEMARLVATLGSEEFAAAHSVVQAAFAHHALTHIHPFADGNGRVARTLASVYLMRSVSLPFFMFVDQKPRYLEALDEADAGRVSQFVTFVLERVEDLSRILVEQKRASNPIGDGDISLTEWRTRLDAAAAFARAVDSAVNRAEKRHRLRPARTEPSRTRVRSDLPDFPQLTRNISLEVGDQSITEQLHIGVDLSESSSRPFRVTAQLAGLTFDARQDEVWATTSTAFEMRIDAWLDQVIANLAAEASRVLGGD